jgi:hypothetical protein
LFVVAMRALAMFAPAGRLVRHALDLMHRNPLTIDAWEGFRTSVQKRKTGSVLAFERKDSHSRQHPPSHCYGVAGACLNNEIHRDNRKALWQCAAVKLPNAEKAIVELEKLSDYLLNAAHPDNGGKAAFFEGLGFRHAEPETLATAFEAAGAPGGSHANRNVAAWPEICYRWTNQITSW